MAPMDTPARKQRIWMIDVARFYGIVLVFYGHFIERIMYLENMAAAAQYKFIYSFHMPLFFLLAGFISREAILELPFGKYMKQRLLTRIVPFVFFNFLLIGLTLFIPGDFLGLPLPSWEGYREGLLLSLFGLPMFNIPTWFLLCLFSVEMLHYAVFRHIRTDSKILLAAFGFYIGGYFLNSRFQIFDPANGRVVGWNYWFIHEAIVVYGFYLLGIFLRRRNFLVNKVSAWKWAGGAALMSAAVFLTFSLNRGPFEFYNSVVIMLSSHGNMVFFPLTAVAGSLLILFLAHASGRRQSLLSFLGQNALILFCLNGIFYHFVNGRAAQYFVDNLDGSALSVFLAGTLMTVVSILFCVPFIYLLNRFVPQLVGRPRVKGPLLRNFL